jgi:hypothetical protein
MPDSEGPGAGMPNDAGATLLPVGRIAGTAVRLPLDFPLLPAPPAR